MATARSNMVRLQLANRGIQDVDVLQVMGEIPRERFLPAEQRHTAYLDGPQPIGNGQTISQPFIVALMTQELRIETPHRVLEIGTGSGYQTAVLARLARHVYSIERIGELSDFAIAALEELEIDNATLCVGDGTVGWPDHAPYDRILCAAASPDIPPAWADQLVEGGMMVLPIGGRGFQELIRAEKREGRIVRFPICDVRFVPLVGEHGWRENDR